MTCLSCCETGKKRTDEEEIRKFVNEAPDDDVYLIMNVALIIRVTQVIVTGVLVQRLWQIPVV